MNPVKKSCNDFLEDSELVQLKLNIGTSVGDSNPHRSRYIEPPLIEVGVL